jgi:radical SAM superfamily enzyme YgiQ (UPF0313 family)
VGIAQNPELVADMDRANFRIAFVGFESMDPQALKGVKKPTNPGINRRAATLLRQHRIAIIAGCIVGFPEDTRESVVRQFHLVEHLQPDAIYAQFLTPYPKTVIRQELLEAGLIDNLNDFGSYDGFSCNTRTHYLSRDELYRSLKSVALKSNFNLSQIRINYFLKNHKRYFLRAIFKAVLTNIYNVLSARQLSSGLDI